VKRAKNNPREFNLEVQPVIKVNNDRGLMRSLRSAHQWHFEVEYSFCPFHLSPASQAR
jgi:hypothetical protein